MVPKKSNFRRKNLLNVPAPHPAVLNLPRCSALLASNLIWNLHISAVRNALLVSGNSTRWSIKNPILQLKVKDTSMLDHLDHSLTVLLVKEKFLRKLRDLTMPRLVNLINTFSSSPIEASQSIMKKKLKESDKRVSSQERP